MAGLFGSQYTDVQQQFGELQQEVEKRKATEPKKDAIMEKPEEQNTGSWLSWFSQTTENAKNRVMEEQPLVFEPAPALTDVAPTLPAAEEGDGIMTKPRAETRFVKDEAPVQLAQPDTPVVPEAPSSMNLTISNGTRAEFPASKDMFNISLDFNSFKGAKGTEVIIPDNADAATRKAAEKFNELMVAFAAKHGYSNYKNRGVKTRGENKRGVSNTIHVEPFFTQDSKIEKIIAENMAEFSKMYTEAFGDLNARLIKPHGKKNSKGVLDRGATSTTFGDELAFGELVINSLMGN